MCSWPSKIDTSDFGEIAKQKIGYGLREVQVAKRLRLEGKRAARNYEFDPEKLKRIAPRNIVAVLFPVPNWSNFW